MKHDEPTRIDPMSPRERLARQMVEPTGALAREPDDGWIMADPYPMSPALVDKLHGLIRAMCPTEPDVPELEVRIEQQLRRMMRYMQPFVRIGFKAALHIIDAAAIPVSPSHKPLRKLPRAEAQAVANRLSTSVIRPLADLVVVARAAVIAPFYDLDEVWEHIGYRPVPFMRDRVALRKRLIAGEAATPGDAIGPFSDAVADIVAMARARQNGGAA